MKKLTVALVKGDGSAPEMMEQACLIATKAARNDGVILNFHETPMGWKAYLLFGDTLPQKSLDEAIKIGTIFFGGVGDTKYDNTIGVEKPKMKPEARALLTTRKEGGLLINCRPMIYYPELASLTKVKPEMIPATGIKQIWIRFLLQDSYYGNIDFLADPKTKDIVSGLGVKLKDDVTGDEEMVVDMAYYRKETIEKYIRVAFKYAKEQGLPLMSVDKANVIARDNYWRKIVTRVGAEEFPDVPLRHQFSDSATALLFTPAEFHGVIACGNAHGDNLSDGAAAALGSMGMMCSSAINPDTGVGMFESGAGTAPTIAGQNKANPIGRILTAAMMLRHRDMPNAAESIEMAVRKTLQQGFRTADLVSPGQKGIKIVGTREMGALIMDLL